MHGSNYERYMLPYIYIFCAKNQKAQHHMAPTEDLNHFKMTFITMKVSTFLCCLFVIWKIVVYFSLNGKILPCHKNAIRNYLILSCSGRLFRTNCFVKTTSVVSLSHCCQYIYGSIKWFSLLFNSDMIWWVSLSTERYCTVLCNLPAASQQLEC